MRVHFKFLMFSSLGVSGSPSDGGVSEGTLKAYQGLNHFLSSFIERVSEWRGEKRVDE